MTDTYKIDHNDPISQINNDTLRFAYELHIEDRLGKFKMKDAYVLFKDDKPNFENKLQPKLINSSKTELGIISKNIIQNIVLNIQKKIAITIFGRIPLILLNGLEILKIRVRPLLFNLT